MFCSHRVMRQKQGLFLRRGNWMGNKVDVKDGIQMEQWKKVCHCHMAKSPSGDKPQLLASHRIHSSECVWCNNLKSMFSSCQ